MQNSQSRFNFLYLKHLSAKCKLYTDTFLIISDSASTRPVSISKKYLITLVLIFMISLGGLTKYFFLSALTLENKILHKIEKHKYHRLKNDEFVLNQNLTEAIRKSSIKSTNDRNQFLQTDFTILIDSSNYSGPIYPVSLSFPKSIENKNDIGEDVFHFDNIGFPIEIPAFICPAMGRFSSFFGIRTDPVYEGSAWHNGIDIAGLLLSPILCSSDGIVVFAGNKPRWGNVVIIDHFGNGFQSIYAHLYGFRVKKGDTVSSGYRIGLLGNTGKSTGPHLHFEIRYLGKPVDPLPFLIPDEVVVD